MSGFGIKTVIPATAFVVVIKSAYADRGSGQPP